MAIMIDDEAIELFRRSIELAATVRLLEKTRQAMACKQYHGFLIEEDLLAVGGLLEREAESLSHHTRQYMERRLSLNYERSQKEEDK